MCDPQSAQKKVMPKFARMPKDFREPKPGVRAPFYENVSSDTKFIEFIPRSSVPVTHTVLYVVAFISYVRLCR